jgi:Domain of unknown function (DUF3883)
MIYNFSDYLAGLLTKQLGKAHVSATPLSRTRLIVEIRSGKKISKFRILAFAIGGTGRGRSNERRLEITSTYEHALEPLTGVIDIVIGVERQHGLLVGIDADRLNFGGSTSNASTFVYTEGFDTLNIKSHDVRLTPSKLINDEKQVYMQPGFFADYVAGARAFHKFGVSTETGAPPPDTLAEKPGLKLTLEDQVKLAMHKMEVGKRGEQVVHEREVTRLRKKHSGWAERVEWTSQTYPYRGYDILSFDDKLAKIYLEVKSSTGTITSFHFTENEFRTAENLKDAYQIVCVSQVLSSSPDLYRIQNPVSLISAGKLKFIRDGLVIHL